jgi:hypothetical protein
VTRRTPLRSALLNAGVPGDGLEEIAVLNGMRLNDPVDAGTVLKIVR